MMTGYAPNPQVSQSTRCIVDGCECRDARIMSRRTARFVRHLATIRGQTATRDAATLTFWAIPVADDETDENGMTFEAIIQRRLREFVAPIGATIP
jgi:hypothetical protein